MVQAYTHAVNDIVHTSVSAQRRPVRPVGTPSPLSDGHARGYLAMQIASELSRGIPGVQSNAKHRMVQAYAHAVNDIVHSYYLQEGTSAVQGGRAHHKVLSNLAK